MAKPRFKATSIQMWNSLVKKYFGKKLMIEENKDREDIYSHLDKMGLQREKLVSISHPTRIIFDNAVKKVGIPFWLSLTPPPSKKKLKRLTLLNVKKAKDGWSFITSIKNLKEFKILVIQYPTDILFKGSALVSVSRNGIVEFIRGDNHIELISGKTIEDPMIFNKEGILHYSNLLMKHYQNELFEKIVKFPGHYEFQYAKLNHKKGFSFFDYNDEPAYENIDAIFHHLENFLTKKIKNQIIICQGLPVSHGHVSGICRIVLNKFVSTDFHFEKGEILITDFTSPDMIQIISKASAVVTDYGGVTSHAAIVCRELGIPCISGTRFATTKLKNGQRITVDATNGVVSQSK